MNCEDKLKTEISRLGEQCGPKAERRVCQILTEVVKWVREAGHGSITLHAVDHFLGEKIKTETVVTINPMQE